MTRAVVFAYHDVGVRCLRVLLAHEIAVPLVVTHLDAPDEQVWFDSVARTAHEYGIPAIAPADPNAPEVVARVRACAPDFLFSFYYRALLGPALLGLAPRGALNMHGSLLPRYRGRVPVNWAVIHGERETGASLHYMVEKPDAGDVVARFAVPILPDDTAAEVMAKVTVAAEIALHGVLPALVAGTAPREPQDLARGSYFGARRPQDGVIDWTRPARAIHDLVRGVAPPYPGAFTTLRGARARVLRTRMASESGASLVPSLAVSDDALIAQCGSGSLRVLALEVDGHPMDAARFAARFGPAPVPLPS